VLLLAALAFKLPLTLGISLTFGIPLTLGLTHSRDTTYSRAFTLSGYYLIWGWHLLSGFHTLGILFTLGIPHTLWMAVSLGPPLTLGPPFTLDGPLTLYGPFTLGPPQNSTCQIPGSQIPETPARYPVPRLSPTILNKFFELPERFNPRKNQLPRNGSEPMTPCLHKPTNSPTGHRTAISVFPKKPSEMPFSTP